MGLITIQLFRPSETDLSILAEMQVKQEIHSQNQEQHLYEELSAIVCQTQLNRKMCQIPRFATMQSPFTKKIAIGRTQHIKTWQCFFGDLKMGNAVMDFLTFQQRQILKQCSRNIKRMVTINFLRNDNNWNLTMTILSPLILKQTQFRQSAIDDQYQHSEDLDRTSGYFENHNTEDISQHQLKLDRIITTLSFKVKYFQGLMPICASLLQCFNQNTSYWLLRYLLFKCSYIQIDIEFYHRYISILDRQLQYLLPEVYSHLQKCGFEINYFVMKWIMGLFSEDMSKTMALGIWDLICLTDVYVIIYVIVTIFKSFRDQIMISSTDQINQMLKTNLKDKLSKIKCEEIIGMAKQFYIQRVLEDQIISKIKI